MIIAKLVGLLVILFYVILFLYGMRGFLKLPFFKSNFSSHQTKTCVIICARNEEANIEKCLRSILDQNFDKSLLEIILMNDASSDRTEALAEHILNGSTVHFQIITNPKQEGKKYSITKAIEHCNSELIISRDADTYTINNNWLNTMVSFYEESKKQFIIAPIDIQPNSSFLGAMQSFENDALAIMTAGFTSHKRAFLCNGANLAFTKKLFEKVKGYSSHQKIASGDDVLFLEDVKKLDPETVAYLKSHDALVYTYPQKNLPDLINQKLRWASKFDSNPNSFNQVLGLLVFLAHAYSLFFLFKALFSHHLPPFGLFFIFLRFFIDFLLLFLASRYYKKPLLWWWLLPIWVIYSFVIFSVGILVWFYKPKWK
jgi:biofilm PGA synthesis N-glycosyltransferase PgaC